MQGIVMMTRTEREGRVLQCMHYTKRRVGYCNEYIGHARKGRAL